ncbi:DinB family protein [Pontibacter sp. H259]|uniref:DinB family protein n=1 Tax=Pontibacter sp. H259 TaxID=3133421 RepID=UPI0030C26646
MALTIPRPQAAEYPLYYHTYVDQLPEQGDFFDILEIQATELQNLLGNLDEAKANEAYAEGKWTIKELFQHMLDSERIFAYRALCIARGETASLPGFDENMYAESSYANVRLLRDMLEEYNLMRKSNLYLFRSFTDEVLANVGTANNKEITLRGLLYVIAGHELHHINILKSRYLNQ